MKIAPSTTLRNILRNRPLAVEALEKAAGYHLWDHLEDRFPDFCNTLKLDPLPLSASLSDLGSPPADTDWDRKPMYYLVDYLTRNHRDFRERDLPGILQAMDLKGIPCFPDSYVCKLMEQDFQAFAREFLKHMEEEETFLFPKIMRNEACFRFRELAPEPYKGSVNVYLATQPHKPDVVFKHMILDIREKVRNQRVGKETAALVAGVNAALEAFEARLMAHADLESNVLLPWAGRLEQELYENSAPNPFRYPGHV